MAEVGPGRVTVSRLGRGLRLGHRRPQTWEISDSDGEGVPAREVGTQAPSPAGERRAAAKALRADQVLGRLVVCVDPEPGNLAGVRHIILVLSGKGGVGKSTISTELALALRHQGKKVGILDVDLCGPSIPHMLRAQGKAVHQCDNGWVPVFVDQEQSISLMSVGFLLENPDEAVVWRGPKKHALIKQFVSDVAWGQLDYLVVDTPPGTSDEHMATMEALRPYRPLGALVVTTPQAVSIGDVRRELTFCKKTGLQVIGVIENMSGFTCPHCAECTNVFSSGSGEELARLAGVPFLGPGYETWLITLGRSTFTQ